MERIDKQIEFILEIDKLKNVFRKSYVTGVERYENSAEHCWHVSVFASVFAEHADKDINLAKVVKMLLIHDIVEIDAGDTYFFDDKGNADKLEREIKAAERIFGLLPEDQAREFRSAWEEYEARETDDAIFAYAMDRFIPVLHNFHTGGKSWKEHGIRLEQVMTLRDPIEKGSKSLWVYAERLFQRAVEMGMLKA